MIRLAIRCRAEDAERVLAELLELVPGGVEEEYGPDWAEFAVYGPPGELPALPEFEAMAGESLIGVSTTEIPDDWADRWRDFHEEVSIGDGRLVVRPSWLERTPDTSSASRPGEQSADTFSASPPGGQLPDTSSASRPGEQLPDTSSASRPGVSGSGEGRAGRVSVVIDPGQAFGTGAHHTTRICLEFLLDLADRGRASGELADLGTGSGVLAIAAAKLGFAPVRAYDSERAAVEAARENAAVNGVVVEASELDLRRKPAPRAPVVLANLAAPLLRDVAGSYRAGAPAILVCSGLLRAELDSVREAFEAIGMRAAETRVSGDWAGILFIEA